jgi:hypothetical protein
MHLVFLCVACNARYLEVQTQDKFVSKRMFQLLYTGLPLFCICMAHVQWSDSDNWRYVIGIMGSCLLVVFWINP